ncbi:hypothetical protein QUF76_16445 [Desulfobacterales bacterium HSG16]|nr:hypothetical protein [Desulfobacterales bacterium HSG16]
MAWLIKQILFILAGFYFLYFGITVLIASYSLKDPFSFITAFFSSNLIILISITIIYGIIHRGLIHVKSNSAKESKDEKP